jgi:hypothetical protein
MTKLTKRHFWIWFKRHHAEYFMLCNKSKSETKYWLNELNTHLRAYYKFFRFGLIWEKDKTATLIISVDGKVGHFKKADDLIAYAPVIPGWTFFALDQPRPIDLCIENLIKKTGVDPQEFKFSISANSPLGCWLTIYHPMITPDNYHEVFKLAYGAVYNILGERSFGLNVGKLQVTNLSYANDDELKDIEELPGCIDSQASGVMVNEDGNLVCIY